MRTIAAIVSAPAASRRALAISAGLPAGCAGSSRRGASPDRRSAAGCRCARRPTQLTVIRCGARSRASAFVIPASPAFAVTTCARPAAPRCPVSPPMLTIEPPPARAMCGSARLRAQERAVEDHRQHAPPVGERHVRERLLGPDRGIVHERVDASEALDRRGDHRGDGGGIGHVGDVARRAAGRRPRSSRTVAVDVGVRMQRVDHHVGAAGGERARDRPADVAGAAGDQHDLPGQFPAGQVPSVVIARRVAVPRRRR